jgi:ubiquinone biosynthesis protein COQ4
MKKIFNKIALLRAFFRLVKDPTRTTSIFKMSEALLRDPNPRAMKVVTDRVFANSEFRSLYATGYMPKIQLQDLTRMPQGSLGRHYAELLNREGFDMDFYPTIAPRSEMEYLVLRLRQTHDFFHLLTGYDTSLEGELALQSFIVAQTSSGFSMLLVLAGLLHVMGRDPQRLWKTMNAVADGFVLGRDSNFLLGICWEELLPEPLMELQEHYLAARKHGQERFQASKRSCHENEGVRGDMTTNSYRHWNLSFPNTHLPREG